MLTLPIHFAPYLKEVIWGGDKIAPLKNIATSLTSIGESWEISAVPGHESIVDEGPLKGRKLTDLCREYGAGLLGTAVTERYGTDFPLLIKIIDAARDLSVQVHPDDELAMKRAGTRGKTEMWHVLSTEPGARIHVGLRRKLTSDELMKLVEEKQIMDAVASYESKPGDTFFIPAGRIHAIGAGNLLVEIQESSDITYRLYDYDRRGADGKPRELHLAEARDAIDYTVIADYRNAPLRHEATETLVDCPMFTTVRHEITGDLPLGNDSRSFMVVINLGDDAHLTWQGGETTLRRGNSLLLPASMSEMTVCGPATLLAVTVK